MEDIVNRLRGFKSAAAQSWAHEATDEIESLRAQLAELKDKRNALEERYECNTAIMHARTEKMNAYYEQLLATQAHAARLVEALERLYSAGEECEFNDMAGMCFPLDEWNDFEATLFTPINLDALHEALARECERLAHLFPRGSMHAHKMLEEAAAHRAKKDSHQ